jgi:acetyl-CoA carboxylase carboxyltransferase component
MPNRDDWKPILEELERRRAISRAMGGPERVERLMTARGKLDARRRLETLFDPGTFVEFGGLVGGTQVPGDALVAGFGKVDGRNVVAAAEDFTVLGGSIGQGSAAKRYRAVELARQERVPLVFMLDGAGHRLTDTGGYGRAPNDLLALADLSGRVPMVCLVLGASAGHGALTSPLSDFTIMSAAGAMFTGGPPLVKAALGEDVTKEALGGPEVCAEIAGTAHNVAKTDEEAIALARRYLAYLPSNRHDAAPHREGPDAGPRLLDDLLDLIPPSDRKPYKMHRVLERLVDRGSLFEIQPAYGASLITAFAFVGGQSCAIVANNPWLRSGSVDSAAAIKAMDFLETAGRFNLPVIFLADNPGVMAGTKAEREGILKWAGKMFRAERRLRVPKIHVTFRKAFGFGSTTMAHNPFDHQTLQLSFPNLTMSSMPAGPGGQSAKLDAETQARVEAEQKAGAWRMASSLGTDDVIDPRELRNKLLQALELARDRIRNPRGGRDED